MSYLDLYQSSVGHDGKADANQSDEEESRAAAPVNPVQAHYRNYYLTSILAEEIVAALSATQAIDMAYNAIDQLPRTASPMLIALDVSYNVIERPIVMNAGYHLIELNMSYNRIVDLRGIALLDTLEFLDVSSNMLSRLEGLENMKRLKVLKLQHNKISTFQSLRLLTYNVCLSDVRLEGNTIVDDPYFKVKLINYIPNLKYLDGTTVWRRTSLQSRVVNDDLQYSDLCARTPASVQKYAKLSKRSGSLHNLHDMHDLTSSMLTMQGLRNFNSQQSYLATPMRTYNRPLPEHTPLPSGLTYLGVTDTARSGKHARNSPERSLFRAPSAGAATGEADSDIDLLPVHLQAILRKHVRAYASPRRSVHPLNSTGSGISSNSPVKKGNGNAVAGAVSSQGNKSEVPPRSRSALPWRNPPTLAPNLELGFKSRRGGDADSVSLATPGLDTSRSGPHAFGGGRANSVTRACQRMFNAAVSVAAAPQVQKPSTKQTSAGSLRAPVATPQPSSVPRSTSPVRESPPKMATSRDDNFNTTSAGSGQWMNPDLNSAIKARASVPFDNNLNQMESTMNSSLFVLQKSFDADHKRVRSDNGSVSSSSAQQRGRMRVRQENLQLTGTSDSGARSVSSSVNLRSVTPTKASIIRANFTSELIRATQVTESQARELRENRTYSRPSSPSRSPHRPRNPAYTYLQGTSSPTKPREELDGIPSYSVRTQPFSPQSTPRSRPGSPSRKARSKSPPRVSSTARILDVYKEMSHDSQDHSRHASRGKHQSGSKVPHYASSRYRQYSPVSYTDPSNESHVREESHHLHIKVPQGVKGGSKHPPAPTHENGHGPKYVRVTKGRRVTSPSRRSRSPSKKNHVSRTYSEESKSRDQWEGAPPPPPPTAGDDSPYRRFLQLRERLSNKYVQSAAENGEFFEPVRSSSSDKHEPTETPLERTRSKDHANGPSIERARSESLPLDVRHYSDGVVEMKGQEYPETQTEHVLSVAQPIPPLSNSHYAQEKPQESLPPPPPPQELSFEQLKEQYQRQYQIEYEKQRQEQENLHPHDGRSSATPEVPPVSTSFSQSTALSRSVDLPAGTIVAPPAVPPRSAGYEALFDLIHQRRSVLEKITQPRDLSPDKTRHTSPGKERIGGAISHLKHRQEASVNVIQSVTRERTVPVPVHNGLLQVSLSTPALHSSINHYASMAQAPHPSDSMQNALGMMHNSFLNRLTSNNPYMTPADNRHSVAISAGASPSPPLSTSAPAAPVSSIGARFQGVTNLIGSYPAPPPYVPQGPPSPPSSTVAHATPVEKSVHIVRVGSAENSSFPVSVSVIPTGPAMPANGSLAQAIRDLQAKQTRDISALKKQ